ncbi:MAG: hypothetical protein E7158_05430 [Firmicutes bacterium]|nr:hypothetical protein [Bacillota bacterium]
MKKNKISIFNLIVLLAFSAFVLFVAFHHEIYEDEGQSWLIARDLSPIGVIKQMAYEGHSPLWYFILMPFAKLGFPVITENIISCLFAVATVYLILEKIECNKFYKLLFIFSGGMIFWYSVISRPYCMIPFLLILISIYYKDRKDYPYIYSILLALLCQTHMVMLPTAFLLALDYYGYEFIKNKECNKKKIIKGLIIFFVSLIVMCTIVIIAKNMCKITESHNNMRGVTTIKEFFEQIKITYDDTVKNLYGNNSVPNYYKYMFVLILISILISGIKNIKQCIIFFSQFLFTILIHAVSWFVLPARAYLFTVTLFFWILNYKHDKNVYMKNYLLEISFVIIIIMTSISSYKLAFQDIKENYSTSKITAEYIEKNIPKGSTVICTDVDKYQSVVAYLNKNDYKFYIPNRKKYTTYVMFDDIWLNGIKREQILEAINELKKKEKNIYIMNQNLVLIPNLEYKYTSVRGTMKNFYPRYEQYTIYRVKNN